MLKFILLKFWPAFVPIILYIIYRLVKKVRQRKEGEPVIIDATTGEKRWYETEIFWVVLSSLLLLIGSFLVFIVFGEYGSDGTYQPAQFKDGVLIPGKISE